MKSVPQRLLEGTQVQNMPNNYRYKFIQIIDQRKAFFKQKIPRTNREKKEADKGMLITYRNIDRKKYNLSK